MDHAAMNAPAQLVRARVMHARLRPARHRFVAPVFYLRLNLDRLDACNGPLFGVDRRRPVSLRTRDYGPRDGSNLAHWMRALLAEHGVVADGEIWLQTFPRVFGFAFNPVSFWHCHDRDGHLQAVLAEVNSTFGETHCYLLRAPDDKPGAPLHAWCAKRMHVSPFCRTEGGYRFRIALTAQRHHTAIGYHDADGPLIHTSISGRPVPMTTRALAGALLRYPLLGVGVVARIHWHALCLWLKRVPFYSKPARSAPYLTVNEETSR